MRYRNANYTAFYVATPFKETNLGAYAAPDFCYYNLLRAWKEKDPSFEFNDAHEKTYNVRDDSEWETLKQRLHERLNVSKNVILILSKNTKNSAALREEIDYAINRKDLPIIVAYADFRSYSEFTYAGHITQAAISLWNKVPVFRDNMCKVPTIHVPFDKAYIGKALANTGFKVQTKREAGIYLV